MKNNEEIKKDGSAAPVEQTLRGDVDVAAVRAR